MTIHEIRLAQGAWRYDDEKRLGQPGGFGEVFEGEGDDGPVAVKRLLATANQFGHRELDINRRLMERNLEHVVPVYDAGQDAGSDRYFLVMPVCGESLQDVVRRHPDGMQLEDVTEAVSTILKGLTEVSDLVHRDLKPSNILRHQVIWKIADFELRIH